MPPVEAQQAARTLVRDAVGGRPDDSPRLPGVGASRPKRRAYWPWPWNYLRHLARAHPAVYAVAHATALSNLSVDQRTVGDHSAALASSAEAVDILRPLAEDDPAHLPLLAITLNNLSTRQSRAGDVQAALASVTEVVEMRRELAETNPTAFLPALATALNNRTYRLTETGDRQGALVCVDEAVTILRTFVDAHPAAYLPRLASFLTHLSQCQEDDGQGRAAASSATEAVRLFRRLTRANPRAHLSDFVTALNRFTALRHDTQATLDVWADAVTALGANPVPQAELRARYAGQLAEHGALDKALEQLVHAALVDDMEEPHLLRRARQAIRTTVAEHGLDDDRLPDWATSPLPDAAIELVNEWAAASDWHHAEAFLRAHGEQLMAPGLRHDLQVTAAIFPGHAEIGNLTGLLDAIDSHGIEQILAGGRRTHDARLALRSWLGTDDWQTSKDFLDEPEIAVHSPEAKGLLRHARSQVADQHLAILELSEVMPTDEVYAIVVDQGTAVEQAYQAIERADIQALRRILAAHDGPVSGAPAALFEAVNHLADGDTEAARRLAVLLARNGAFNQRTAYAILLRALASHDPDFLFAEELADIVASDGTALDPARGTDEGHGERVTQ
ncbi:hypothetical protein GCM10017771_89240 [Streptomyces capitiformicae]|uniref:Tetratricopeptide repeat protein n=1 Tax=Streptomyces capitiformicae TaxID=2014920 RepID=A0A919DQE8_9ACTN|nr:hypothetical protein GCM10017771_89240 [Streptomyces capitiformicae]